MSSFTATISGIGNTTTLAYSAAGGAAPCDSPSDYGQTQLTGDENNGGNQTYCYSQDGHITNVSGGTTFDETVDPMLADDPDQSSDPDVCDSDPSFPGNYCGDDQPSDPDAGAGS